LYARLRAARFVYWVMDLNPDEAVAAGWLREGSPLTRALQWMSRFSFRHAERIIALDKFMRSRIEAKGIAPDKIAVIAPWSHDDAVRFDAEGREVFRRLHGLSDKFVVMYSGNHSPCHPLDTLLAAAEKLAHRKDIVFCFVGGGSEWRKISERAESRKRKAEMAASNVGQAESCNQKAGIPSERNSLNLQPSNSSQFPAPSSLLPNLLCLPYQPLSQLSASLSAADMHVVVMGEAFVGTIHPCKIYNVLAVGAPILCLGPKASHLSEVLDALQSGVCACVRHGDVDGCVSEIERIAAGKQRGEPERYAAVARRFSQRVLLPQLVAELERGRPEGHTQPGNVIISKSKW
jgi:glycosyltransferase involved in cell wall biosynthesis